MAPPRPESADLTKRPNTKTRFEEQEALDLFECAEDPLYFMRKFMRVQHPTKGAINFDPFDFQEEMVRNFEANRFNVVMTARQMGKALALDTPIPTPSGWTTMGEIRVGDLIMGDDGNPTRVSFATETMHERDCYEVEFDNGEVVVADAEHLWKVNSSQFRDGEAKVMTTLEMLAPHTVGKKSGHGLWVPTADPMDLPDAALPISPYTFGVWLGDGETMSGRFCGHPDDAPEMRASVTSDGYVVTEQVFASNPRVNYQRVVGLTVALRDLGVLGSKRIPTAYLRASHTQRVALLQGLMDTDGHAAPSGGFEIVQKIRPLADDIMELLASLGMKARMTEKVVAGVSYWKIRFSTTRTQVFRLSRKVQGAESTAGHSKNHRFFIRDIRPCKSVPVRCIQVDNQSRMFLCGKSMVPTHNTTVAVAYLLWKAMFHADTTILICANKYDMALEIMHRLRYAYENLPDHIRAGVTEYNKGSITFDNGSRVVSRATTKDSARGLSVTLCYVDEFAFVMPNKAAEFWTSIRPTLATGGSCIITSTPQNDEDEFAQIWKAAIDNTDEFGNPKADGLGKNGFRSLCYPWTFHPERDEKWADEERASLGDAKFRQEHGCVTGDTLLTIRRPDGAVEKMTMLELAELLKATR